MAKEVEPDSAAGYRTYKNNRYAALGAKRALRTMREFFRGKDIWMLSRAPDAIEQRTLALFERLNNAGLLQLLQAGIEEENAQAAFERAVREAKRKGEETPADPDEAWDKALERSATQPRHPYGAPYDPDADAEHAEAVARARRNASKADSK
jgi:hypothetical protein